MAKPKVKIVYAKTSGTVRAASGASVLIRWGEHWPANDPIVQANPSLFTDDPSVGLRVSIPLVEDDEQPIEQATAAPGEKRQTPRRTRKSTTSATENDPVSPADGEQ